MSYDLKALSRKWFEEVWNKRRTSIIPELSHPDATAWGLAPDGKSILYGRVDQSQTNVMLIDNFR